MTDSATKVSVVTVSDIVVVTTTMDTVERGGSGTTATDINPRTTAPTNGLTTTTRRKIIIEKTIIVGDHELIQVTYLLSFMKARSCICLCMLLLVMAALCNSGAIIFLPCSFFLLSIYLLFFPHLISAAADWMSTILPHMVWP